MRWGKLGERKCLQVREGASSQSRMPLPPKRLRQIATFNGEILVKRDSLILQQERNNSSCLDLSYRVECAYPATWLHLEDRVFIQSEVGKYFVCKLG